jgi:hypothetical protein
MVRCKRIFGSKSGAFASLVAAVMLPMEAMQKKCRKFRETDRARLGPQGVYVSL